MNPLHAAARVPARRLNLVALTLLLVAPLVALSGLSNPTVVQFAPATSTTYTATYRKR